MKHTLNMKKEDDKEKPGTDDPCDDWSGNDMPKPAKESAT